jgi:hypothetical protein
MPTAAQEPGIGHIETTVAEAIDYRPEFRGYARVDPISLVTVKAGLDGVIEISQRGLGSTFLPVISLRTSMGRTR